MKPQVIPPVPGVDDDPAAGESTGGFSKRDIAYLLFKQWRLIATMFLVVTLFSTVSAYIFPRLFEAISIVSVKRNIPPVPGTSPSSYRVVLDLKEVQNSEIQLLKSRAVLATAADDLLAEEAKRSADAQPPKGLQAFVRTLRTNVKGFLIATGLVDRGETREDMIDFLSRKVKAKPLPISDLIEVMVSTKNARRSADTVNAVTRAYLSERTRLVRRPGVHRFYEEQIALTRARLEELEDRVQSLKAKTGVVSAKDEVTLKLGELSTLSSELRQARADREERVREIRTLEEQIAAQPEVITSSTTLGRNPIMDRLKQQLLEVESARARALVRFDPRSKEIAEYDEEMADIRESMKGTEAMVVESEVVSVNDVRRDLESSLSQTQAKLEASLGRQEALAGQVESLKAEVQLVDRDSLEIERLQELVASTERIYFDYLHQREEARAAEATSPNATNVDVIHYAAVPARPKYPRIFMISLGMAVGLFIALGAALVSEYLDRSFNNDDDVNQHLGLRVLASLPASRRVANAARLARV